MRSVLIATSNKGKFREIKQLLGELEGVNLISLSDIDLSGLKVNETGATFKENAFIKAKTYGDSAKIITIADDSGLEVDFLNRAPGVKSARYAGSESTDKTIVEKLLKELKNVPAEKRTARFKCVACLYNPETGKNIFTQGTCEGVIADSPKGDNGFGYDPVFIPNGYNLTMAQLPPDAKNSISHRGRALKTLKDVLLQGGN